MISSPLDMVKPGKMAEKKDNDNDNEDTSQVHLVVGLAVSVRPHMGVLYPLKTM